MYAALNAIFRLTAVDMRRRKQSLAAGVSLYAAAILSGIFAVGFLAVSGALWLARTYDPVIATALVACAFVVIANLCLLANYLVQRQIKKQRNRVSTVRTALIATGLTAMQSNSKLPALLAIGGILAASQFANSKED